MDGVLVVIQLLSWYKQVLHNDVLEQANGTTVYSFCLGGASAEENGDPLGQSLLNLLLLLLKLSGFTAKVEVGAFNT